MLQTWDQAVEDLVHWLARRSDQAASCNGMLFIEAELTVGHMNDALCMCWLAVRMVHCHVLVGFVNGALSCIIQTTPKSLLAVMHITQRLARM